VLTLDQALQHETERALLDAVDGGGAQGGTAIVVDVRSGDVLAMAQVEGPSREMAAHPSTNEDRNRALTDIYEPGSTNKVITLAAALEAGVVTPETTYEVPDELQVGDRLFEDSHEHATEIMTVADILRESSNIGTIKIATAVGKRRLDAALRAFGFGRKTSIEFPAQAAGVVTRAEDYSDSDIGAIPIGQGIAVTAMQMLDVYTTIANDGVSRPPRLVAGSIDGEGEHHENEPTPGERVVSSTTAEQLRTMLAAVVADGTGTKAELAGYTVAGKTGTALKVPYERNQYVASFVGFAPAEAPRYAAIVVVDTPRPGEHYGGDIAAPAFARVMQYALQRGHVAPSAPVGAFG
jgi:cell division protein FtsI (penicillin-binding protein 3)